MLRLSICIDLQNYKGDESEEGGSAAGGRDNVNGSSEAPTEGIILIVFVLLMMCL